MRCAVYTRKSCEEGLEQSFNSLQAQRDACEAFIASQVHEGWRLVPGAYDDGGLSGGSMERPALQRLLQDVRDGLVDIVVVYKVDRLTRSLADFAKLTELFDAPGASFVSVTQAFNTSTSMGRLTLNVLLSFAQFEREVAGERIRDKIALSKRRGMWMGGLPPLGYDGVEGKLIINSVEADTVRPIFRRYCKVGSIAQLKHSLDADGIVSKHRRFQTGKVMGGASLSRGALYQILRNRICLGQIEHRGEIYQGEHQAIVPEHLWNEVQGRLKDQSQRPRGSGSRATPAPLARVIYDADGTRMTPTYSKKAGRHYRHYTFAPLVRGSSGGKGMRLPAPDLEQLINGSIADRLNDQKWLAALIGEIEITHFPMIIAAADQLAKSVRCPDGDCPSLDMPPLLRRVEVGTDTIVISLDRAALVAALGIPVCDDISLPDNQTICITVPAKMLRCGKQVRLIVGEVTSKTRSPDAQLVQLIGDGHRWFADLSIGRAKTIAAIAKRDNEQVSHVSRTLSLAFLAPDIVDMILAGTQPATLTHERLKAARPLPLEWDLQRLKLLG
nr:recombinase family protein [Devosia subaequoris]